jgi:hypothetical protein
VLRPALMLAELSQPAHYCPPASCIRATNIPYSQLISLIKLRTNSHHLDIERLRHASGPEFPDHAERVPGAAPLMHCMMNCIARWSAPIFPPPASRVSGPVWSWPEWEQTCAPCSQALNTWLLLWLRSYTAFLLRRTNNLALLLHDYVELLLLSATSNGCTWPQTDVKHT